MSSFIGNILKNTKSVDKGFYNEAALNKIKNSETVVIWGVGVTAETAFRYYTNEGVKITCFADNNKERDNELYQGLPVNHSDKFFELYKSACIIIAANKNASIDIENQLRSRGYNDIIVYDINLVWSLSDAGTNRKIFEQNAEPIDFVYNLLADEKSKHVFSNLLKYRLNFDDRLPEEVYDERAYFDNDVVKSFQGTFLDCGAFDGDTLQKMLKWDKGSYDKYYAFEPDEKNYTLLEKYCEPLENVYTENMGIWSKKETLFFTNSGTMTSTVNNGGQIQIDVDSIDNMFRDDEVNFIKMDIEGSEIEALMGSKNTISKCKPILAISNYHKPDHLWEVPIVINRLNSDYKVLMRHHSRSWAMDSVCYAVNRVN